MYLEYMINCPDGMDPIMRIGLNYIRFAVEEPQLFRFLFQSGYAGASDFLCMVDSEGVTPILEVMREGSGLDMEQKRACF